MCVCAGGVGGGEIFNKSVCMSVFMQAGERLCCGQNNLMSRCEEA